MLSVETQVSSAQEPIPLTNTTPTVPLRTRRICATLDPLSLHIRSYRICCVARRCACADACADADARVVAVVWHRSFWRSLSGMTRVCNPQNQMQACSVAALFIPVLGHLTHLQMGLEALNVNTPHSVGENVKQPRLRTLEGHAVTQKIHLLA